MCNNRVYNKPVRGKYITFKILFIQSEIQSNMDLFLAVAEVATEFSGDTVGPRIDTRDPSQRLPCSLSCFGKWEIVQEACTMVSHYQKFFSMFNMNKA